jgi:hypothetical protein
VFYLYGNWWLDIGVGYPTPELSSMVYSDVLTGFVCGTEYVYNVGNCDTNETCYRNGPIAGGGTVTITPP